jgi:TolB-like protein/Tfp pilus assembly protein PilF
MEPAAESEVHLEIGHVLFIDIVGYSKLFLDEQKSRLRTLTEIVLATPQVARSTGEQLVRLPTGDGMALVFRHSTEEPARCALEIAQALKTHSEIKVRMGVNSGPVSEVTDLNGRTNIAGAGINTAQRVMDCGDAGHILLSQRVAEDLAQFRQWSVQLHDLGECEVKHGVRIHLVNLYTDELGNAAIPSKVRNARVGAKPSRRYLLPAAALAILFLIALAVFFVRKGTAPGALKIPEKSIAVLPFANTSNDPGNEYFSDGLSEELISSLSRLSDLKVIGRTSSFQFKNKTANSRTIGQKLGVFYLLEGSVRKSADRVRIAVELVKSADGASVWSETYDRELKDIFAVQSEIAGRVAKQLKVALFGRNGSTFPSAATPSNQNVDAYNALLQGNFYSEHRTAADFRKAIGYYEEAIHLDPQYALAYAKLAITAGNLANNFMDQGTKEGRETVAKARTAADTALLLDPDLSEAHLAKGGVLRLFDLDFTDAEAQYRRAYQLAPQNPGATQNLAVILGLLGRFDEAVVLAQQGTSLDPLRSGSIVNLAVYLAAVGRYDEAEAKLREAIALQPQAAQNHMQLTRIEILHGKPAAAVEAAKKETDPFFRTYSLALAYFADNDRARADAQLKKLIDEDSQDAGSQIASVYALRKEPDKVFEWLDRAWSTHDPGISELLIDPFLRTYKGDPRFIALARKVGLMPKAAANL